MIFTVREDQLRVLLVERGNEPYRGQLALPGGYLRGEETLGAHLPAPVAGTDAREAFWVPVHTALQEGALAFDHSLILRDGLERARSKLEYTSIATVFCVEPFTLSELRRVYEVIWGFSLDPSNFRRKLTRAEGLLEPTGDFRMATTGRPAALYRRGPATLLMPPFLRAQDDARASA